MKATPSKLPTPPEDEPFPYLRLCDSYCKRWLRKADVLMTHHSYREPHTNNLATELGRPKSGHLEPWSKGDLPFLFVW
jgi:hypothetical protein